MRIIEAGKAPEILFNCDICNTKFAENAGKCNMFRGGYHFEKYWSAICPICGAISKSSEVVK